MPWQLTQAKRGRRGITKWGFEIFSAVHWRITWQPYIYICGTHSWLWSIFFIKKILGKTALAFAKALKIVNIWLVLIISANQASRDMEYDRSLSFCYSFRKHTLFWVIAFTKNKSKIYSSPQQRSTWKVRKPTMAHRYSFMLCGLEVGAS